ncbi:MAG: sugar ABC transporter substrate-binding protein [Firmicutes bacterium]|nr:sugar ABC transporter substrate-binding protein [Bacillota bacterium]
MKKKIFIIWILAIFCFLSATFAVAGAAQKEKIVIGVYPDLDTAYKALLPKFQAKYPNIEVEIKSLGYADHHNNLVTTIAAGSGAPDVVAIEIGYIAKFVSMGGLVDLRRKPFNADRYKKNVVPFAWAQATTDEGKLIAMPVDIAPGCAYYRRDIFASLGQKIEDIKTLEDLYNFGKKVTRDTNGDGKIDRWLIANAGDIATLIIKTGPFFDKRGNCLVTTQRFKDAFTWAKKFRDAGMDAQIGAWTNEWYTCFKEGLIAYQPTGAWLGGHLQNWMAPETAGKWGVAPFPALKAGQKPLMVSWGGSFLAIPQQSPHKEAAWKFIEYATTDVEAQMSSFKTTNAFPAWMPAWSGDYFKEKIEFLGGQQARLLWIDIAKQIPAIPTNKFDVVANDLVNRALTQVLSEGRDIDEALAEAKEQIERRTTR